MATILSSAQAVTEKLQSFPTKTLLVIDENPDFIGTIRTIFVKKGYTVLSASNTYEACYAVGKKPDVILCDMALALRHGIATLKQIRLRLAHKRIPIVLMSWHATLHDIRYALKIGADDCIAKTDPQERLVTFIDTHLHKIS